MQRFYKGRTNNHLTWVMVDATDFATPESAVSAATTIKIYGKLRGQAAHNFVSSGAGSLTNDIQHVGASATGIYTIALTKPDLSDASAAWYDQYIIALSATGCARQVLVVDGGIDASAILAFSDAISNAYSAAVQANSRVLLVQSRLSDLDSRLASDVSDILSGITALSDATSNAYSAAVVGSSRILLVQSRLSDLDSRLASEFSDLYSQLSDFRSDLGSFLTTTGVNLNASAFSDLRSAIAAGPAATITASDISDIASAVRAILVSDLSDILSAATQTNSRALVIQSMVSDTYSQLSDFRSDLGSLVTTTGVQLNASSLSDLRSAITAITATVSASDMSDIASRVDVLLASRLSDILSAATQINSRVALIQSTTSDTYSALSDAMSAAMSASDLSDIASAVWAHTIGARVDSRVLLNQSRISDVQSALTVVQSMASDAASAAAQGSSRALVVQSMVSDVDSALTSRFSDLLSLLGTTGVQLNASTMSDIRSAITAGATGLDASALSDIASAVVAAIGADGVTLSASSLSDIRSMMSDVKSAVTVTQSLASDAHSAAAQANSRALALVSTTSDIYSMLSDLHSDVGVLSGVVSDTYSALVLTQSLASDAHSAATVAASRALAIQSTASDIYSLLGAGVELGASSLSDLRSMVAATELDASDLSDIASAVWARTGSEPATVVSPTGTMAAKVDWLTALSRNKITQTATVQSLRNDGDSADIASAAVSDDGTTFTRGEFA
jgi:hypothetical protein